MHRRRKRALSQSTTPSACTPSMPPKTTPPRQKKTEPPKKSGEISMRIKCVRFSVVPPRHAKLASHRDARCAHRTWAGRLLGTMTQNYLFCSENYISMRIRCCHFCVMGTISDRLPKVTCARHRDKLEQASDPASCVYPKKCQVFSCPQTRTDKLRSGKPQTNTPDLRHLLPQRQILRTGHVPEESVQVPENLCERCAGTSEHV